MFVLLTRHNKYAGGMAIEQNKKVLDEIGSRIVRARKSKGVSQEALAGETGLDRVAIGYIEQGRRRPSVSTIVKIAKGLNIKLEDLFKGL